ncbi:MAG: RHS repeat-associated core domain-containing protein [Pyrinomonadaceae bacterium]
MRNLAEPKPNRQQRGSFAVNLQLIAMALILPLFAAVSALGQDKDAQKNYQPGVPFTSADIESVNNTNGNMLIDFGFGSVRGRGTASAGYALKFNSKLYESHQMTDLDSSGQPAEQLFIRPDSEGGWRYDSDYRIRLHSRNDDQEQPIQVSDSCGRPNYKAVYVWKLMMYFPDGSQHEFRPTGYSDESQDQQYGKFQTKDGYFNVDTSGKVTDLSWTSDGGGCPNTNTVIVQSQDPNPQMTYYSTDGTFMRLVIPNGQDPRNPGTWTLYMPDGSRVASTAGQHQKIYDRNGNYVTQSTVTLPDGSQVTGYVDQLGRYVARKAVSAMEDEIHRKGFGGEDVKYTVKWKYITVIRPYLTDNASQGQQQGPNSEQVMVALHRVVDEIILPEQLLGDSPGDPLRYKFSYDGHEGQASYDPNNPNYSNGWGELTEIETPSGAKSQYGYAQLLPNMRTGMLLARLGRVADKSLVYQTEYDGQTETVTEKWLYEIYSTYSRVTGPDGAVTRIDFFDTGTDNDLSGRVYKETRPDGSLVERTWYNNKVGGCPSYGCGSMRRLNTYVKTEYRSVADATGTPVLTAISDFEYDKNGNVTQVSNYDYVPYSSVPRDSLGRPNGIPSGIAPERKIETAYFNPTENADDTASNNPNSYWNTSAKNVTGAVKSSTLKTAANAPVSHSEFVYDDPDTTANPVSIRVWSSYKGGAYRAWSNPLYASNSIETTAAYDSYGNILTTTDARGIQTRFTYSAINGVTSLYPTQTETAWGTSLVRTATAEYDFWTGLVVSATDADNNITAETEYDPLGRPVKTISAAGTAQESWVVTEYDDALRIIVSRGDLETKGDGKAVSVRHFDEMGRLRLQRALENPTVEDPYDEADGIKVQTRHRFDNPSNPASSNGAYSLVSNPYRAATSALASGEESMGWTLSYSNRQGTLSETESYGGAALPAPFASSGGNTATTGFVTTRRDAARTLVIDQAGKKRISKTNALGQLVEVWEVKAQDSSTEAVSFPGEPSVAYGYRTSYAYDTLNNLKTVSQGVQTRTFSYSSLSRLLSATNPESGTIIYQYDAGGNLTQKTDARGVLTSYTYDNLNRITGRSYSNEPSGQAPTPAVTYTYDNLPNAVGKLTKVENSVSKTEYTEFDILGRVTKSRQTTEGTSYGDTEYKYNLSGALSETKYPSGRVVRNVLDSTGRLSIVQSKKDANHGFWDYAKGFQYTAAGAVSDMQLGNGKWESTTFNSRLQPTKIALGTVQGGDDKLNLAYEYNTSGVADNNGNVLKQTITVNSTPGQNNGFTAVQSYAYDEINRLKSATETIGGTQSWKEAYTFDRYGNKNYDESQTTTLTRNCGTAPNLTICQQDREMENPEIDSATNRIKELQPDGDSVKDYEYDPAGNTIKDPDGRKFFYDGENKQIRVAQLDSQGNETSTIGEYSFDGDGKRVKKNVPATGETTHFVYDAGGKLIAEYSTIVEPSPSAMVNYLTQDTLGSPRILTDRDGNVSSRRDFLPFGGELLVSSTPQRLLTAGYATDNTRQKFTSYERDVEVGLDYAKARMLEYGHGRFTSPDPLMASSTRTTPQSWNRFTYVLNNPHKYVDPSGMVWGERTLKNGITEFCYAPGKSVCKGYTEYTGDGILSDPLVNGKELGYAIRLLPDGGWERVVPIILPGGEGLGWISAQDATALRDVSGGLLCSATMKLLCLATPGSEIASNVEVAADVVQTAFLMKALLKAGMSLAAIAAVIKKNPDDLAKIAKKVVKGYGNLECLQCAKELLALFEKAGVKGTLRELTSHGYPMVRRGQKTGEAISRNGRHFGVQVGDKIYDLFHPKGLSVKKWADQFEAINGVELVPLPPK